MKTKRLFGNSIYEQAIRVVLNGVTGDSAEFHEPQSVGGRMWKSKMVSVDNEAGKFIVTMIELDGEPYGKVIFDYNTGVETEYIYNKTEEDYTLVAIDNKEVKE